MDTNRSTIIGLSLPVVAAAFAASLNLAAAAAPAADSDGTLYAAVPSLSHHSRQSESKVPTGLQPDVTPIRDIRADRAVSGSEPDPETFDKVGLETWWKKHQKSK